MPHDFGESEQPPLARELGLFSSYCLVAGSVIGSGIFLVAADVAAQLNDPIWAVSVWLVAGAVSFVGGLLFAELGAAMPNAGGQYIYLRDLFHPLMGFLYGWTLVLVIQTGTIAALGIAVVRFASRLVDIPERDVKLWAAAAIVGLTLFNTLGVKKGAGLLNLLTALKLVALLGIAAVGLTLSWDAPLRALPPEMPAISRYGVALIAAFWAFDGWNNVTFVAGEMRNPTRHLPIALALGILSVTFLYVLVNLAYYQLLEPEEIRSSAFVAADAAERWGGPTALRTIIGLVAISALGCLNAMVLAGARVIYAMAHDGSLPRVLGKVDAQTHSPNVALYFQAAWSCILVWSGRYDQLFTYVVFAAVLFYGLTACALFRLRRRSQDLDPAAYRAPLYPVLPLLYLVFVGMFSLNALVERPWESSAGIGIILAGIPAFYFFRNQPAH